MRYWGISCTDVPEHEMSLWKQMETNCFSNLEPISLFSPVVIRLHKKNPKHHSVRKRKLKTLTSHMFLEKEAWNNLKIILKNTLDSGLF